MAAVFGTGRRGGARSGAGRPRKDATGAGPGRKRGVPDKKTGKLRAKVLELTQKAGNSAKDEMAWDFQFLGSLARAHAEEGLLDEAAKYAVMASEAGARAAPYMHNRMPSAVNVNHSFDLSKLNNEQLAVLEGLLATAAPDAGAGEGGEAETQH